MKNINKIIAGLPFFAALLIAGCSGMNDNFDHYIRNGEILYIGRVDSAKTYAGKERFLLQCRISDPRVEQLKIFWSQKTDSIVVDIPPHASSDSINIFVENVPEGEHSLLLYSLNSSGLRSVVYETMVNVYGNDYHSILSNRTFDRLEFDEPTGKLTVFMLEPSVGTDIGLRFFYTNRQGKDVEAGMPVSSGLSISLPDVDQTKPITYRTCYLPEPTAIDTFFTEPARLRIEQIINVALNKPVTVKEGDFYSSAYTAEMAVDGIIQVGANRWFSRDDATEHWLIIDLQGEYDIYSFSTWIGAGGNLDYPVKNFNFQIWKDEEWVDAVKVEDFTTTGIPYKTEFPAVKTGKVKYYVPPYSGNGVRMYEIAVYTKIVY
jgi:hypothetical protein